MREMKLWETLFIVEDDFRIKMRCVTFPVFVCSTHIGYSCKGTYVMSRARVVRTQHKYNACILSAIYPKVAVTGVKYSQDIVIMIYIPVFYWFHEVCIMKFGRCRPTPC